MKYKNIGNKKVDGKLSRFGDKSKRRSKTNLSRGAFGYQNLIKPQDLRVKE